MSENQSIHPTHDELAAFTLGQLQGDAAQRVEEHVSACDPCCQTMVGFSDEDTFVDLLRQANQFESLSKAAAIAPSTSTSYDQIPAPLTTHPRYQIEELVGYGGMGRVFKARHRVMDRSVALKFIHQEWVSKPEAVERFQREVKAAASLNHPNIVTAYDAEQAEDLHFLVMEFVDGVDLSKHVSQHGRLSVSTACDYVRQVADGLQHAHDQGMVHRDIKPHNLVVTNEGVIKILDFGLASLVPQATTDTEIKEDANGNLTIAGAIMGTPDFISPEQAQDAHNVDGRSDIYSLGMTLYYLLSGRVPFDQGSAIDKLRQHAEDKPESLCNLRTDVPEELEAIVNRMTEKDPSKRYQSPKEVIAALSQFVDSSKSQTSAEPSDTRKIIFATVSFVMVVAALVMAAIACSGAFLNSNFPAAAEEVHGPLGELDSYVVSMMASPHELVFLNVGEVGEDDNYFTLKRINNGVMMDFPAMDGSRHNRRQGKKVDNLKRVAKAFNLKLEEESSVGKDGAVNGVHIRCPVTGQPGEVAETIRKVIIQSFNVDVVEECEFTYHNMPGGSSGGGATSVSSEEFLNELAQGERVYFGEINNLIYLVPEARRAEKSLKYDADVWFANINELPSGAASQIRTAAAKDAPAAATNYPVMKMTKDGSMGTPQGSASMHHWKLEGRLVGEMQVKLMVAQNGEATVVQQFDFSQDQQSCTSDIRLLITDPFQKGSRERNISAKLDVSTAGMVAKGTSGETTVFPLAIVAPFASARKTITTPGSNDDPTVASDESYLLYSKVYFKDDFRHRDSIEGIIEGSKNGGTFIYLTVNWKSAELDSF